MISRVAAHGTTIEYLDTNADVVCIGFGILNKDIEVPVVVEYPGIKQLVLTDIASPTSVRIDLIVGTDKVVEDTCIGTSNTTASELHRGSNSIP